MSTLIIPGITKTPSNNCLKFGSTQIIDGSAITNCRCSQLGCTEIVTFWLLIASLHQAMRWRSSVIFGWKFASTNQEKNLVQGSDVSIKWNFCARPSDVISRENRCWRRGKSAVFSGYYTHGVLGIGWNLSIEQCVSFFFTFSYTCSCQDGFFLSIDGHSCSKKKHIQGKNSLRHEHWL